MNLVERGFDICTTFKELDPETLLKLFKTFRSWPEYDENLFMPSSLTGDENKVSILSFKVKRILLYTLNLVIFFRKMTKKN